MGGGTHDGVVRVSRIAEAWYTQQHSPTHRVRLVNMSHGDIMTQASVPVAAADLRSPQSPAVARQQVAHIVAEFLVAPAQSAQDHGEEKYFGPFTEMFVNQEGSWFWTSNHD